MEFHIDASDPPLFVKIRDESAQLTAWETCTTIDEHREELYRKHKISFSGISDEEAKRRLESVPGETWKAIAEERIRLATEFLKGAGFTNVLRGDAVQFLKKIDALKLELKKNAGETAS